MIMMTGRMCLEAGAYLVNSNSCSQCSNNNLVTRTVDNTDTESRDSWDEDEEVEVVEDIQYNHVCGSCDHIIALHKVRKYANILVNCPHDAVQVLAGGGEAGVQDGVSAVWYRRGQRLRDAS